MSPSTRAGQEQAGPLAARIRSTSPGSTPRSTGPRDVNEFGWLIGWVMECQEKGYITKEQLGGLESNGAMPKPPTH